MKYVYTQNDFDKITWERIEEYIDKMSLEIKNYLQNNNLKIKYIIPIVRGGAIPAILFSHKLDIIDILPIQLKYNYEENAIDTKINFNIYKNITLNDNECILLVEGNHVTGKTANIAKEMILNKFPNAKIIYASITRDYYYKDSLDKIVFDTKGMYTNETKKLGEEDCEELGINYKLVSLYPWEDMEEELQGLNS